MKKILVVDGNSIINRAFYAIRNMTAPNGLSTNGIFGFLNIFFKNMEELSPDGVAVTFDLRAKTFRHKEYELYKANRHGMPDELAEQMPVLKDILRAMNVAILEIEGYEADDVIGTVAKRCEKEDYECYIVTGDKDDLQLASEKTKILLTTTAKGQTTTTIYTDKEVIERYGVTPLQFIDIKGLMGDTSDNIPGVPGIGEKTAMSLISEYGSIDNLYKNLDNGKIKGATLTKLREGQESAILSRHLATIVCDVPIEFELSDLEVKPYNTEELAKLFENLQFKSFLKKLDISVSKEELTAEKTEITEDILQNIISSKEMNYYFDNEEITVFFDEKIYFGAPEKFAKAIQNEEVKKITHDAKNHIIYFAEIGIEYKALAFDTAIAAYILDPARAKYVYSEICEKYLGKTAQSGFEALLVNELYNALNKELKENEQEKLYYEIELPLVEILAKMQMTGFLADKQKLEELSKEYSKDLQSLETAIYMQSGETFNINSPKQLGEVLFEKMGLPPVKKNKSGYSTDADVMKKLADKHPIINDILDYRALSKLKSTYADGLQEVIGEDGRIHSSFNQTVTTTGRISSNEPNMQNIPVKTELGRELRRVFIAQDEYVLIDADYSQIELRVLAHMSGDKKMQDAFLSDQDIHTRTAAEVFGVAEFMVTPEMRSRAKAVNFGIVYGIGDFTLGENLGISRKQAKEYIENYLKTYSDVDRFMKETVEEAHKTGYVKTLLDRRRYIPEILSSKYLLRSFGERAAQNAPIQGSAADIIKIAMIRVYEALKKEAPKSRLILQVHDELIVEAHISEKEKVREIIKREMENAYPMSVPLKVDIGEGKSWYDAK